MLLDEDNPIILPAGVVNRTEAGCIEIFENIFSDEVAQKIIDSAEKAHSNISCPLSFGPAFIGSEGTEGGDFRSNLVMAFDPHLSVNGAECNCDINNAEDFLKEIYVTCVKFYQEKYDVRVEWDEGFQLLKYGPGKEYKPHSDAGPGHNQRVVSGIIYLNPKDYEGGGTYFVNYKYNLKTTSPSIALFPSNYAYLHRAKAVLSGTKYAIVTWMG